MKFIFCRFLPQEKLVCQHLGLAADGVGISRVISAWILSVGIYFTTKADVDIDDLLYVRSKGRTKLRLNIPAMLHGAIQ